jgi:nitrate reductase assembly molybdenum cofactor insertion protein NarJ
MQTLQNLTHYELLAALFDYPGPDYPAKVAAAQEGLTEYPDAAGPLAALALALPAASADGTLAEEALDEVQEIFTRSFDVQSITTLGVGYVVFGDDYKRGVLLVNLNRELREAGIDTGTELSDHLPTVLRLLTRWEDSETMQELAEQILHPALSRMIGEFGSGRTAHRNKLYEKHYKTLIHSSADRGTIFREPLLALLAVVKRDFGLGELAKPEQESTFLRSVVREMEIEAKGPDTKRKKRAKRAKKGLGRLA